MKLMNLLKEINKELKESGDLSNVEPIPVEKISSEHYKFDYMEISIDIKFLEIELDDLKNEYELPDLFYETLDKEENNKKVYHVVYALNGNDAQFTEMTLKEFNPILKTVIDTIEKFVKKEKPFGLFIFGLDKKGDLTADRQKTILYYSLVKNHLLLGYRFSPGKWNPSGGSFEGFIIFKEN